MEADAYDEEAVEEFSEVLYTLREVEVAGWLRSLQLRGINLPDALKDEAFLIIGERRTHPLRFWRGVGEQDAKRKGGFRYSGRMVAGYGFGSDLHLPYPGVRPESIRLSIW